MTLAKHITAITGALVLSLGAASAQEATTAPAETTATEQTLFANPFDASTWYDGAEGMSHEEMGAPEAFNMAHPSFWMSFIDPKTHTQRHMQMTNPATYAQFMDPGFYMNFANPTNWLAWFNPSNYETLVKADTYAYWMQPGAYMHAAQPNGYMQTMDMDNYSAFWNPATYMKWMDPSEYDMTETGANVETTMSFFNPATYVDMLNGALSNDG